MPAKAEIDRIAEDIDDIIDRGDQRLPEAVDLGAGQTQIDHAAAQIKRIAETSSVIVRLDRNRKNFSSARSISSVQSRGGDKSS